MPDKEIEVDGRTYIFTGFLLSLIDRERGMVSLVYDKSIPIYKEKGFFCPEVDRGE